MQSAYHHRVQWKPHPIYGNQLFSFSGNSLKTPFVQTKFRQKIYHSIVGKCGVETRTKNLLDTCKVYY